MSVRNGITPQSAITGKLFQKAMLTMLVAELSGAVTAMIDGALTGRYLGNTALAACGLGSPYYSIASVISGVLMVGSTGLCTNAIGRGNRKRLSGVFSLTVMTGVAASCILALAGVLFSDGFAVLFGAGNASEEVFAETSVYLKGLFPGAPGFVMFVVLTPILQLDGDSVRPNLASFACAVVDIAGDLLNIYVFHGGVYGMAVASAVSHYTALLIVLSHFLRKDSLFRFKVSGIRADILPTLLKDGLPRGLCMLCRGGFPVLLNILLIGVAGDMGVTAYSTMNSNSFLIGSVGWGIGGAMLIIGGMMAGEQDINGLKTSIFAALKNILLGVTPLAAVVFACAPWISKLFLPGGNEVRVMASAAVRCYALCLPFLAFNVSAANYFQVISKRWAANLMNIGIEAGCVGIAAYVLSRRMGAAGVWLAFPVGQAVLSMLVLLGAFLFRDPERMGTEAHMLLPKGFGISPEDRLERSPADLNEVNMLSGDAAAFCRNRGIIPLNASRLALCVEEMAGNVIQYGFSDGKQHHLDVRVLVKDGNVILRLRDDCMKFDMKEKAEQFVPDPDHPEKNIGIRLVMGMAKDIVYTNTMNTNNLMITVTQKTAPDPDAKEA
ncbi:MAG: ATP-binding protein [Clostridia bacterium]|nr:ATP-binding protein [Clostridia bacterium]